MPLFTNTSFDAQNIVSKLLSSLKAYRGAKTCQAVAPGCQLKEKATDSNDCTLIKAPLDTDLTAEAGTTTGFGHRSVLWGSPIGESELRKRQLMRANRLSPKGQIPLHGTCGATAEVQYGLSHAHST
jgi:hypothetical protein